MTAKKDLLLCLVPMRIILIILIIDHFILCFGMRINKRGDRTEFYSGQNHSLIEKHRLESVKIVKGSQIRTRLKFLISSSEDHEVGI